MTHLSLLLLLLLRMRPRLLTFPREPRMSFLPLHLLTVYKPFRSIRTRSVTSCRNNRPYQSSFTLLLEHLIAWLRGSLRRFLFSIASSLVHSRLNILRVLCRDVCVMHRHFASLAEKLFFVLNFVLFNYYVLIPYLCI